MKKIVLTLVISCFALLVVPSAHAATISGNGAFTKNTVSVKSKVSSTTKLKNNALIVNSVGVVSSTGGNTANANTGGPVSVTSGDAITTVSVGNMANTNTLVHDPACGCGCEIADPALSITGNGAFSWNTIFHKSSCSKSTVLSNTANFVNEVTTVSETGGNTSSNNTGGAVDVVTGDSAVTVTISNVANSNSVE